MAVNALDAYDSEAVDLLETSGSEGPVCQLQPPAGTAAAAAIADAPDAAAIPAAHPDPWALPGPGRLVPTADRDVMYRARRSCHHIDRQCTKG